MAAPSDATRQAWGMATGNAGNYQGALNQAYANTAAAGTPLTPDRINQYVDPYNQSVMGSGGQYSGALNQAALGGAGAYTDALNSRITGAIPQYMNPYTDKVVGALQTAANKNLFDNQLPQIQDRFVSAGQSRSPQEMQMTNNALYQSNQALDQATAGALQQGYQSAVNSATGAATAGMSAGIGSANTGFGYGATGYQSGLNAAQQQQQMQQTSGAQFGQLGALTQQLGGYDVGQVAAAGQAQDASSQANLNAAMNNFYAQQQWPYQNLAFASNIIRGQPVASNTQTVGLQPSSSTSYTASPLSAFIGTTLGGSALLNGNSSGSGVTKALGFRRGGLVRGANDNRGALSLYGRAA